MVLKISSVMLYVQMIILQIQFRKHVYRDAQISFYLIKLIKNVLLNAHKAFCNRIVNVLECAMMHWLIIVPESAPLVAKVLFLPEIVLLEEDILNQMIL